MIKKGGCRLKICKRLCYPCNVKGLRCILNLETLLKLRNENPTCN